jgi:hypothetical protein
MHDNVKSFSHVGTRNFSNRPPFLRLCRRAHARLLCQSIRRGRTERPGTDDLACSSLMGAELSRSSTRANRSSSSRSDGTRSHAALNRITPFPYPAPGRLLGDTLCRLSRCRITKPTACTLPQGRWPFLVNSARRYNTRPSPCPSPLRG